MIQLHNEKLNNPAIPKCGYCICPKVWGNSTFYNRESKPKSMYDHLIRDCLEKFVCKQIDKRKHAISKHCTIFISSVLRGMSLVIIKSTNVDHKLTNICQEPFKLSSLSLNTNRRPDTWYLFMPIGDHIVSKTTAQICYISVLTKDLMQRRHWLVLHKLHICHMKKSN